MSKAVTEKIPFNMNDVVEVKLTDFGRKVHREDHVKDWGDSFDYTPPKEDEDGWSRWQIHALMLYFGKYMHLGCAELPFETPARLLVTK